MKEREYILSLVAQGNAQEAINRIKQQMRRQPKNDSLYLLLGKVYHKLGNWQKAMENYLEAIDINPQSPAKEMLQMATNIMDFFYKERYNH